MALIGMSRRRLLVLGALATSGSVVAQSFPSKPIRVLIGVPAGGTQDVLTRAIAEVVRPSLGALIIENRSGAAGRIAAEAVKNAEPDGHTLLLGTAGMMTMFPNAYHNLRYDPIADYAPIINAASFELAMVVHRDVPANDLAQFIAWAKAQGVDGSLISFASYGAGTPSHFLGEMLNRAAGLRMVHVPYKGAMPARQDLMGGTVPVHFDTVGGALSMPPSGRIKVLATSGAKRSPAMPATPTFKELGYPEVIASAWFAFYAPAKTSKPVLEKLRLEFAKAVNSREVRQQLLVNGMYPVGNGPAELLKTMRDDIARWGRIMQATNFQAQD